MLTRVGNYELIRPLGAGGMAQTFVAKRRGPAGFEQKVCLKRILPEYAADAALVEQFLDEAKLLANLRHANIVQVYDFGEADGSYFMALELIDGADLEAVVRHLTSQKQGLPLPVSLHIVSETLKALHYAHHAELDGEPLHLVHRDISPSNLLLSRAGEVKLADFGIAKSKHRRHKTRAGFTKGKVAYMSPEQVRGGELDGRSDLFAVGIVLHELLTGVHPFDADTDIALLNNILTGTRPNLAALTPPVRPELVRLIDALLAVDPAERPDTAADALALVPPLEQQFRIERQIGEVVNACVAARAAREGGPRIPSTPPAAVPRTSDVPGHTTSLPTPPTTRPSAAPLRLNESDGATTEMSGLSESVGTDALLAAQAGRSNSAPGWLIALAALAVAGAVWLGIRYHEANKQLIAAQPSTEPTAPTQETAGQDGSAPELPRQASAEKPTDALEADEQADDDEPEVAPVILHAPGEDHGSSKPSHTRSEPRESHRANRHETSTADRTPRVLSRPAVQAEAPSPPVETKPAPVAAPETPKQAESAKKHRAGISISSDDF